MIKRVFALLFIAVAAWIAWTWITFPDVAKLKDERPTTTAFMEIRKKQLRREGKSDELEWKWVSYGQISPSLRRAILVAEDNAFYEHEGVDVKGMREALERDLKRRKITHGGSTITQQLAKNLYLSPSRNPLRKVREYFIARSLEKHLTKKRILEIYMNVVEFGERVYGAEAAARHYFGKPASSLTAREAALLAGCLPNPRVMNPADPNKRLRARQQMILARMRRWGYEAEREVLTEKKPEAEAPTATAAEPAPTDTDLTPPAADTDTTATETDTATEETPTETAPPPTTTTATETAPTETSTTPPTNT